ncbi:YeaC family protein [Dongshaea marina]|uniref:YeaC family protein n=1 Tax=Dongshaea marina TaxID=2047966 RepID=UPI000D3E7535|nr:DUF1315 family protein [Dongshaea marina]
MSFDQTVASLTPEMYSRLKLAVELGKWPDGKALTPEQKELSLQAVLLWQSQHGDEPEHMTLDRQGNLVMKSKQELKEQFK